MSDDNSKVTEHVANHPRAAGVLFTLLLVLSQVGSASANLGSTIC